MIVNLSHMRCDCGHDAIVTAQDEHVEGVGTRLFKGACANCGLETPLLYVQTEGALTAWAEEWCANQLPPEDATSSRRQRG